MAQQDLTDHLRLACWAVTVAFVALLLAGLLWPVLAQEVAIECVVPAEVPFARHVALLVDVSGSMDGARIEAAYARVREIAVQPTDDMQLLVMAFGDHPRAWPRGWVRLPAEGVDKLAVSWLCAERRTRTVKDVFGSSVQLGEGTMILPALRAAAASGRSPLTVVLVSDGEFNDSIEPWGAWEEAAPPGASLTVVAIDRPSGIQHAALVGLARVGRGGYYR